MRLFSNEVAMTILNTPQSISPFCFCIGARITVASSLIQQRYLTNVICRAPFCAKKDLKLKLSDHLGHELSGQFYKLVNPARESFTILCTEETVLSELPVHVCPKLLTIVNPSENSSILVL